MVDSPPRVFLSYAHDSEHHKAHVLRFCELLREHGVDANLDGYDDNGRQDWYTWMTGQITESDYVLIVASPRYRAVGDGHLPADRNRGVQSEAALMRDRLHADRPTWTRKLLPVVLPGIVIDDIPLFLQPYCADHYLISEFTSAGIKDLLRAMSGSPTYQRRELGTMPEFPNAAESAGPPADEPDAQPRSTSMSAHATGTARIYQAGRNQYINEK